MLDPETWHSRDVGRTPETYCLVDFLSRFCRIGEVSRGGLNISCISRIGPFKVDIIAKIQCNSSPKWFHAVKTISFNVTVTKRHRKRAKPWVFCCHITSSKEVFMATKKKALERFLTFRKLPDAKNVFPHRLDVMTSPTQRRREKHNDRCNWDMRVGSPKMLAPVAFM